MNFAHYSTFSLAELLAIADIEERAEIAKSVGVNAGTHANLANEISKLGGNGVANFLRRTGVGYAEILRDLATTAKLIEVVKAYDSYHIGLNVSEWDDMQIVARRQVRSGDAERIASGYTDLAEKAVASHLLEGVYKGLSPDDRRKLDESVAAQARAKGIKTLGGSAATLAALNAGGFATYMAMSSILHFVTMGTLTFSTYTAASSVLAVVIGPAGWVALGSLWAYKAASPDEKKLCAVVIQIAVLRAKYNL